MRFLVLAGLAVVLPGCAAVADIVGALEPILDVAVDTAANSAAMSAEKAAREHGGVDPLLVGGVASGGIATLWGLAKAAIYAWNRDPKKKSKA
jgi:hypothetical protein